MYAIATRPNAALLVAPTAGLLLFATTLTAAPVDHVPVTTPEKPMATYSEAPAQAAMVRAGKLPPLKERLPALPPVVVPYEKIGKYGGTLRHLEMQYNYFGSVTRYMSEGLMDLTAPKGDTSYPNLAQSIDIGDDLKTITVTLRKGVKWSDGHGFTTEDVLFRFHDMLVFAEDPSLSPEDIAPSSLIIGGELIEVRALDDYTLVVKTNTPYVMFDKILTRGWLDPMPAHYLKEFHPKYASLDKDATEAMQDLREIHANFSNVEMPTLGPWVAETFKAGEFLTMKRNPYYWKVDTKGQQLPYADRLKITMMKDQEMARLNAVGGEFDWVGMSLTFDAVVFQNQRRGNYRLILRPPRYVGIKIMQAWISREHEDPQDRKLAALLRNESFLKALQWGIDNRQMVTALAGPALADFVGVSFGHPRLSKGKPIGDDPRSAPLWEFLEQWQRYDVEGANAILDELGLKIGDDGYRHYPDGGRVELTVGIFATNIEGEVIQMQAGIWDRDLHIKVFTQHRTWTAMVQPWWHQGKIPMLQFSAGWHYWATVELNLYAFYQYPTTDWVVTGGRKGVEPHSGIRDAYLRIHELAEEWVRTPDPAKRFDMGFEATELALKHHITYPLTFCGKRDAVYAHNRIKNIPGTFPPFGSRRTVRMEQWFIDE